MTETSAYAPPAPQISRRGPARRMAALSAAVALMTAAMAVASTAATLISGDRLGVGWAAVPNTAGIVGTGAGAFALSRLMPRLGPRAVFILGYITAALGGCLTVVSAVAANVTGLTAGMLLLGLGNAGGQLSRYAAADLYAERRRGFAIGIVVWAAAVGAVGGPLLLAPSGRAASGLGLTSLAGPFLLATAACAVAAAVTFGAPSGAARETPVTVPLRNLLRSPATRSALTAMATAQVLMVAVMTAAPMDMHMHGYGLGWVGMTISAHTLGMFALSPLTGRMSDRLGARSVTRAGLLTLVVATGLTAVAPEQPGWLRPVALFLLGYGWNMCFVGGSSLLAKDLPESQRSHVEGSVDAAVWSLAALASTASTLVMAAAGYGTLSAVACVVGFAMAFAASRRDPEHR